MVILHVVVQGARRKHIDCAVFYMYVESRTLLKTPCILEKVKPNSNVLLPAPGNQETKRELQIMWNGGKQFDTC